MKVLNGHEICNYEGIKSLQKILEMRGILMEKTLYDMMDWAGIEELVYSEASDPHVFSALMRRNRECWCRYLSLQQKKSR